MAKERRPPGTIRDAILAYLARQSGEASTVDIRRAVEAALGKVPSSSVRSYLLLNAGPGGKVIRLGRGRYRLRKG